MCFVKPGVVEILTFDSFGPLKSCGMGGCMLVMLPYLFSYLLTYSMEQNPS
jgi:hypothetical protein